MVARCAIVLQNQNGHAVKSVMDSIGEVRAGI
jgi:hypothetical protein